MLLALPVFHETVGHFMVPFHLRIPSKNDTEEDEIKYHKTLHVYGLVRHVSEIAHAGLMTNSDHRVRHPWVKERLQAMEFPVDVDWRLYVWQHQRMAALQCFYDLHGHTNAKRSFVVPRGDHDWPMLTWGFPLGSFVNHTRVGQYKITSSQRQELEDIAFQFGSWEAEWHKTLLPALQVFARVNGHLNVDATFTVPRSELWPEKLWGMRLGYRIHKRGMFVGLLTNLSRECDVLEPIDFAGLDRQWDDLIMPSLEVFRNKFQHCVVHRTFVIPADASWPQAAWGLELGKVVAGVVSHSLFQDQMDFCWDRGEFQVGGGHFAVIGDVPSSVRPL